MEYNDHSYPSGCFTRSVLDGAILAFRVVVAVLATVIVTGCELMGDAKVTPIISQGPPMAALDSQVDIERVAALVPAENSYANKTTSISFKVSGTCISGSVAVLIQIETNSISANLSCNETTGEFSTAIDLSAILDGPLVISISYMKTVVSTAPIYVLQRNIVKDTVNPTLFSIPASFTESAGVISFSGVDGTALYRATFTPNGGGPAVTIESTNPNITVSSLNVGVTYTVSITALDAAGNETPSSNTGTFTKTDTDPPVFSSFSLAGDAANGYISNAEKNGSSALAMSLTASGQTSTKYAVGGSAAACSSMTFGASIPTAADLSLGDVSYKICVELKDSANNTTYGATSAFVRDIAVPTLTLTTTDPVSPSSNLRPKIIGSANSVSTVTLYSNGICTLAISAGTANAALVSPGIPVSADVGVNQPTDIYASAVDLAGNVSVCVGTPAFYVHDSIGPTFTSLALAGDAVGGYINDAEKNGSSALAGSLVASGQTSTKYAVGASAAACSSMTFGVSIPTAANLTLGDVSYKICVELKDSANNTTYGATSAFSRDIAAPTFTSLALAGDAVGGYINDAEKNGSSALAGSLVASGQTSTKYAVGASATACSSMTFGASIPTATDLTLGDVGYKICVELKDAADNTTYGATSAFSRDIVFPTVNAGADFAVNSTQAANNNLATASGYSTLLWTNQSTGVGSITFSSTSSLTNTVLASANGAYTLRLTASDAAGNSALDDTVLTWSGLGGGGGGGGGYAIYVPFIMDTTPYIASWTIASNNTTDAAGTGAIATLPKGTWSSPPDAKSLMSIAGKSNGTMSVVYPYEQGSSNNVLRGAIVSPDLSLPSTESPDSAATMQVASVDVAVDSGGLFNYFYSVGNHNVGGNGGGMYSLRHALSGNASTGFRAGASALSYTHVFARIDSNNKPEVMAIKPTTTPAFIVTRNYDTGSDQSTPYSCGSGAASALTAAWITKGDDYFIGTTCSSDSNLYVTNNKSRSSGGVVYTKTRGSVATSSGITASSFIDYQILDDNDQADLYYATLDGPGYYIKYCPASNCATPTTVYFSGTESIHSVRAVRAADGTVFVVATGGGSPNKLIFIRKTGAATFSSAASYTMNGSSNLTMKIGKRIFEASSPGNSNWTKRHTLFVTQYSHYGDMTTSTDTVTKLAPDALCRGYAFGARLPRPESTVAVIQKPTVSFASQVGSLSGDVYTNESTPTVFKTQADFSNGADPAPGKFVTDAGVAFSAPFFAWAGDFTTDPDGKDCRGSSLSPWTDGTNVYDGRYFAVGTSSASGSWFSAATGTTPCNTASQLMCITK